MIEYYITPSHCIAKIPKSFSSSIGAAIAERDHPEIFKSVIMMPVQYRFLVPTTITPDKPVLVLVRDVVERFLSTCAMFSLNIEEGLESKEDHFISQIDFVTANSKVFKDLDIFSGYSGLTLSRINVGLNEKPVATNKQLAAIKERYKKDIKLIEGIK